MKHNQPNSIHVDTEPCKGGCPKPCCESEWSVGDQNWAVVNAYKNLHITERRLLCLSGELHSNLRYGFGCETEIVEQIDKTKEIRDVVKREIRRYKHGVRCLCKNNVQNITETISRLKKCNISATNVSIETDDNWVKRNLLCSSREDWEMYSTSLCATFKLDIKIEKEKVLDTTCNIAFEITKSQEFCDILISAAIIQQSCNMGITLEVTKEQCEIEWKILLEKNPECDMTLKTYIVCKENGITYDLIQLILDAGLDVQSRNGELFLLGLLQEYKFDTLSFSGVPPNTEETSSFYKDPKAFVERYLRDYNLSEYTIQRIIQK